MLEKPKQARAALMDIDGAELLSDLLRALDHDPSLISVAELQRVADRLAELAHHEPGWGWRYLRNVLNRKIEPGKKLVDAMFRLGAVLDDTPLELAQSHTVTIQALGNVRPGALILADSRLCEYPACYIEFVPRHPRQRFHSARCRELNRRGGRV
ncbi:MAG TPA: hypothetical protein DCZ08_03615 [Anaerolineaceae bacterium]|nr:hypothetical protein [Anaerolineaceae bacterium]